MNTSEEFKVNNVIAIGDPAIGCTSVAAKNGKWTVNIERIKCGDWGHRIRRVTVHHDKFNPAAALTEESILVGVDTGQLGFFNSDYRFEIGRHDYRFSNYGFVCMSGFGDGAYEAKILKENNKAVCVEVTFIFTDEEIEAQKLTH